ncbi:MAG: hypothetical protein LBT79_03740 [Elusimicrobiota bacterium]|jgi:hypothetical protein|nr:hypothetical protein [Elusimicrobiota bacterium]
MKRCIVCGALLDNHPRRIYCDKKECQNKRLNKNNKAYLKNIKKDRESVK